jgi:hypothetical protein
MKQVISKRRVADHGEVYTHSREVNAMLDLINQETERIDSRFLEPACGTGNFLVEILDRKLEVVSARYAKSQLEYERYAMVAVTSIYGIDLLPDNIQTCQDRLFNLFNKKYSWLYKKKIKRECQSAIKYILNRNILNGDALTLRTIQTESLSSAPIVFSQWSMVMGSMLKRRDFIYAHLVHKSSHCEMPLISDLDEAAYIPEPIKDFPLIHFLEVTNADSN